MDAFIGVDLGTAGVKVGLFSSEGEALGLSRHDYPTHYSETGFAEQDPSAWWEGVRKGIAICIGQAGIGSKDIKAVGVDSMTPCLIPVDKDGRVLGRAQIWADRRAFREVEWMKSSDLKDVAFSRCGNSVKLIHLAPRVLWLKRNAPETYDKTHSFLQANGYINLRLTGNFSMDRSHSELCLLADKTTGAWDTDLCARMGIDTAKLPRVYECSTVIGEVCSAAAQETGLAEGTPVIAGGNDTAMACFAMNVTEPGKTILDVGTASNIATCIREPISCAVCDLYHHVVADIWMIQVCSETAGAALEWFKRELSELDVLVAKRMEKSPFELIDKQAGGAAVCSGGVLFLPFLNGAKDAPDARGAFLGLNPATSRNEMSRAVLEGVAFAIRRNMELLGQATGQTGGEVLLGGGASKSRLWSQMFADVTGRQMVVLRMTDAAVFGSAMLAAEGIESTCRGECTTSMLSERTIYEPDVKNRSAYDEMYGLFLRAYMRGRLR